MTNSRRTRDLEATVRGAPTDLAAVEALWRSLLDDDDLEAADRWLAVLVRAWEADAPYRALWALELHAAYGGGEPTVVLALRQRLGLTFAFEELTREAATARLRDRAPQLDVRLGRDEFEDQPVHWVEGDLRTPHLDLSGAPPLIVTGTLAIAGSLVDASHPLSLLVVLGDLVAGQAVTRGELHVAGGAAVGGLWYLCSGNDYAVRVGGDVATGLFLEDGMHTVIGGALTGAQRVSRHNTVTTTTGVLPRGELTDPAATFTPAALDDGRPTIERLVLAAQLELPMLRG